MRKIFAAILLFISMMSVTSCRKVESDVHKTRNESVEEYFRISTDLPSAIKKSILAFKNEDKRSPFFKVLVEENGFPVWGKSRIEINRNVNNQTANVDGGGLEAGDTLVFTPLMNEDSSFVNGFLLTKLIGDSTELHLYRGNDYDNYPYGPTDSSVLTAERITLKLMQLNSSIFNFKEFTTTDTFLFARDNPHSLDSNIELKKIRIKEETSGSFSGSGSTDNLIRTVHITVCNLVPCTYNRVINNNEGRLRNTCWQTSCTTTTITYEEWPDGGPSPTTGGGNSGPTPPTGNCTGTNNCNQSSRIIEGRLPCGNCGPGPIDATP